MSLNWCLFVVIVTLSLVAVQAHPQQPGVKFGEEDASQIGLSDAALPVDGARVKRQWGYGGYGGYSGYGGGYGGYGGYRGGYGGYHLGGYGGYGGHRRHHHRGGYYG